MKLRLTHAEKRRASTSLALAWSEYESAEVLLRRRWLRQAAGRLYYACFHAAQALLSNRVSRCPSHKHVETQLHASSKRRSVPPQRYARLHSKLRDLRNRSEYRSAAAPDPDDLASLLGSVQKYLRYVTRVVPRVELAEILADLVAQHKTVAQELSFEIYHPSPYYGGQTRLTIWQPAKEAISFTPDSMIRRARRFLAEIRTQSPDAYVAGLNSRLNQYGEPVHLLMLDLDTTDAAVECALSKIGGTLVKSGRGFHFIGGQPIRGQRRWEAALGRIKKRKDLRRFVDKQHIEFSLQRGYSTLRLTAGPNKPHAPFFYKDLL